MIYMGLDQAAQTHAWFTDFRCATCTEACMYGHVHNYEGSQQGTSYLRMMFCSHKLKTHFLF